MKNIFLTGEVNIGKSTIINQYIKLNQNRFQKIAGFKSKPLLKDGQLVGYYLDDLTDEKKDYTLIGVNTLYPEGRKNQGITETFEIRGIEILNHTKESDLVILDELGFFEISAEKFQKKVMDILDSDIKVLGVLKKRSNPFLERIKNRQDVFVIEVTINNRDTIIHEINRRWRDLDEK